MHFKPTRRDFLHVGFAGGIGLSLTDFFRLQQAQADQKFFESKEGTAKNVIFIYFPGGMAHQESWDPKPYAPIEYRGPMNSIATKIPGYRINETMKQTAQIADRLTICNSMTHGEAAHERGTHNMFTGYRPSPALTFPSMGSIINHEFGPRNHLPQYVCIPTQPNVHAGTGYLPSSYAPFSLGSDPASGSFTVKDLKLPGDVTDQRFVRRRKMLSAVNEHFKQKEKGDSLDAVDSFYNRAYNMVSSQKAREAFDINKEPKKLRDEYGRNTAGARLLLARRLVEAGSRFVTLTYGGWDMHGNIKGGMSRSLPAFDQAFARLIRDLEDRGMLDETLVFTASEFGRTPKINGSAGRDHWPKVFSVVMAGGGFKKGLVYGTSDPTAAVPDEDPLNVEDWATTIYKTIGITADKELMAPGARPIEIVNGGNVRNEMLA